MKVRVWVGNDPRFTGNLALVVTVTDHMREIAQKIGVAPESLVRVSPPKSVKCEDSEHELTLVVSSLLVEALIESSRHGSPYAKGGMSTGGIIIPLVVTYGNRYCGWWDLTVLVHNCNIDALKKSATDKQVSDVREIVTDPQVNYDRNEDVLAIQAAAEAERDGNHSLMLPSSKIAVSGRLIIRYGRRFVAPDCCCVVVDEAVLVVWSTIDISHWAGPQGSEYADSTEEYASRVLKQLTQKISDAAKAKLQEALAGFPKCNDGSEGGFAEGADCEIPEGINEDYSEKGETLAHYRRVINFYGRDRMPKFPPPPGKIIPWDYPKEPVVEKPAPKRLQIFCPRYTSSGGDAFVTIESGALDALRTAMGASEKLKPVSEAVFAGMDSATFVQAVLPTSANLCALLRHIRFLRDLAGSPPSAKECEGVAGLASTHVPFLREIGVEALTLWVAATAMALMKGALCRAALAIKP